MGSICCCEKKEKIINKKESVQLSQIKEEKEESIVDDVNKLNNDNIIVVNLKSTFNKKIIKEEPKIKNKNTIKNINRRIYLMNKYKFTDDKFEKYIKFTHMNKIISSTTNSFSKQ